MLGIIGGSLLTRLANLEVTRRLVVRTPYGEPSAALVFGRMRDRDVVFLARHGHGNTIPPHEVNYCANIWALHAAGVTDIVAVAAVGHGVADLGRQVAEDRPGLGALYAFYPDVLDDEGFEGLCRNRV